MLHIESDSHVIVLDRDTLGEPIFVDIKATQKSVSKREIIKIAYVESETVGTYSALSHSVHAFNLGNSGYRVELTPYGSDDSSTADERLICDIGVGNVPDIIMFSNVASFERMDSSLFVDLYEHMSGKYAKDKFLPYMTDFERGVNYSVSSPISTSPPSRRAVRTVRRFAS